MKTLDERLDVAERAIRALDMLVKFDGCKNSDVAAAIAEARAILSKMPKAKNGDVIAAGDWYVVEGFALHGDEMPIPPTAKRCCGVAHNHAWFECRGDQECWDVDDILKKANTRPSQSAAEAAKGAKPQ